MQLDEKVGLPLLQPDHVYNRIKMCHKQRNLYVTFFSDDSECNWMTFTLFRNIKSTPFSFPFVSEKDFSFLINFLYLSLLLIWCAIWILRSLHYRGCEFILDPTRGYNDNKRKHKDITPPTLLYLIGMRNFNDWQLKKFLLLNLQLRQEFRITRNIKISI